jgi:polyferredoxin
VGYEFFLFFKGALSGAVHLYRPPAVEGFLPISSLLGLRYFLATGNYDYVHPAGLTIIIAIIITAFLTRKSFCSWVCPVGTISRILELFSKKVLGLRITVPVILDHLLISLKYMLCGFFLYMIFVRMSVGEVRAFLVTPYNIAADAKMLLFFRHLSVSVSATLVALGVLSVVIKNFWCRYLCPYGGFLGLIALLSPAAIHRDVATCIDCRQCFRGCPYQIRVHQKTSVRTMECTACLNCVSTCPVDECLTVTYPAGKRLREYMVPLILLLVLFVFYAGARGTGHWVTGIDHDTFREYYSIAGTLDHPK